MNEVNAKSRPVAGGHHGLLRKVHRSDYETVNENGIPILFATAGEAELAAWHALRAHLQSQIVGSGDKASAALSQAEEKFGKLLRGGGKTVQVERR
ncbi:hypothetical protein C8D77_101233 [Mesorhizobium loti]|uniref:Uncharacterized protein n=1 Tax=Rhizobium loti TaxID=381 RepID=A0A8E2WFL9_RHILI|nr:hypothetical protein [Mesorhizobium loti]PWJ93554.1 hypothetical protein C8D77_101233 [Mesorhizobium loti]